MTKNFLPTLVIGLDGTSQRVLVHLKKELLSSNDAQMPELVKLLCIDSNTKANLHPDQEELSLSQDELMILEAGKRNQGSDNDENNLTHLSNWLSEGTLKELLNKRFNFPEGAGRFRQFGRLALSGGIDFRNQQILQRIPNTIMSIQKRSLGKRLHVFIVSAIARSTGSGMLIDVAVMVRRTANLENIDVCIEGFLIGPVGSSQGNDPPQQSRSFAAYRELDRIMSRSVDTPHPSFGLTDLSHPFDSFRIVQPDQEHSLLDIEKSDFGIFPDLARTLLGLIEPH